MKLIRLVAAFSLCVLGPWSTHGQAQAARILSANPVWLQRGIHWERAPRTINPKLSAGAATILYFSTDGRFRMFSGTVYKQDGLISASAGDARSLFEGTWELRDSTIFIKYRLMDHDIRVVGEVLPGPEQILNASLEPKRNLIKVTESRGLNFRGYQYEVNPRFSSPSLTAHFSFLDFSRQAPNP
jgi:hypothetical protein